MGVSTTCLLFTSRVDWRTNLTYGAVGAVGIVVCCCHGSSLLGEGDYYGRGYCDGIAIDGVLVVMSLVLVDWNDQLMLMINGG